MPLLFTTANGAADVQNFLDFDDSFRVTFNSSSVYEGFDFSMFWTGGGWDCTTHSQPLDPNYFVDNADGSIGPCVFE
jgi:hypothetical protein